MQKQTSGQPGQLHVRRLVLPLSLALLLLAVFLWGFGGIATVSAVPNTLYVDGTSGSDTGSCQGAPAPCATIGYAISQAVNGDTVLIAAGTYTENLEFSGITVTVRGGYTVSGTQWLPATGVTTVDGNGAGRVAYVHDTSNVVLEQLTITGGKAPEDQCWGAGVNVSNGNAIVRSTVISANEALCTTGASGNGAGGGVNAVLDEGPATMTVVDSVIANNVAGDHGAAAAGDQVTVTMTNVLVTGNESASGTANVFAYNNSDVTVVNATIAENNPQGAQAILLWSGQLTITNSIMWNNALNLQADPPCPACFNVTYSDIEGGWAGTGNIDADPLFVDPGQGDYHLQVGSPAIDAGTATGAPAVDLEGTPRDAAPDMGAYEFTRDYVFLPVILKSAGQ